MVGKNNEYVRRQKNGETSLGIMALVLAFLASPYGIPLLAGGLIVWIAKINSAIKTI